MKLLASLDLDVLEERIVERVRKRVDPFRAVWVIVPTRRLGAYVKQLLARRLGAVLGVHVVTHRGLALRAYEGALEIPPAIVPPPALRQLLDALVRLDPLEGTEHLARFRGARAALLETFRDLRDAGISPAALESARLPAAHAPRWLTPLYRRFVAGLERLREAGWCDDAGLIEGALPIVGPLLERKRSALAIHHGAYDLIEVHWRLLQAVAAHVETELLVPAEAEGEAFKSARPLIQRAREDGGRAAVGARETDETELVPPGSSGRAAFLERLRRLHDPMARWDVPLAAPRLVLTNAQGAEDELRAAALDALSIHLEDGVPLEEIAIMARSLKPYAPFLRGVLGGLGIPFETSASESLARDPELQGFLSHVRALASGLERGAVLERLGRALPGDAEGPGEELGRWEAWSREGRVVDGIDDWMSLEAHVRATARRRGEEEGAEATRAREESAVASVRELLARVRALEAERVAWGERAPLARHRALLGDLARRLFVPIALGARSEASVLPSALERLLEVLEAVSAALEVAGEGACEWTLEEVERLLREAACGETAPLGDGRGSGLRVLDVMQARGLRHHALVWIGFHSGAFPREARPDPYLTDEGRARLARAARAFLSPKLLARQEERLLLAGALASSRKRIGISFQRADEDGKVLGRSTALREVARVFLGRPDARALLEGKEGPGLPRYIPVHPGLWAAERASRTPALLLPGDVVVASACLARPGSGPAAAARALEALGMADSRGFLSSIEAIESFAPRGCSFDGGLTQWRVPTRPISPSALERLAQCPQFYFLRHVLGVEALEEDPTEYEVEDRALGKAAHAALERLFLQLHAEGLLGDRERAWPRAEALLGELWPDEFQRAAGPALSRFPGLLRLHGERWLEATRDAVREDLEAIASCGEPALEAEARFEGELPLPGDAPLRVRGYIDRILHFKRDVATWLDDYKTGAGVEVKVRPVTLLRGLSLQLFVYRELVAARLGSDPLSIDASLIHVRPDPRKRKRRLPLGKDAALRGGVLETIGIFRDLLQAGLFPLQPDGEGRGRYCDHCDFRRTCRRSHAPTLERLEQDPALADMRDVGRKTWKTRGKGPKILATLAQVRAAAGSGEGDDEGDEEGES